jgi:transglutaminase-like putative cysteine protease
MLFQVTSKLEYAVRFPSTLMLNIHAQRSASQSVVNERFNIEPAVPFEEFVAQGSENRFIRLKTGKAKKLTVTYEASVECQFNLLAARKISAVPVAELDRDALPYLFPSRYCQSDKLGRLAWDLFGDIEHPYQKVTAIVEWIHSNVEYVRGSTTSDTSAYDTVTQRTGVCRDFAHLGIALCRALNIPARYFAGYAFELQPADFHACFECHIGGSWLVFDATRLAHLNGLVRIGTGRDAADASVASIFGGAHGVSMEVECLVAPKQNFVPITRQRAKTTAVSLEAASGR